MSDPKLDRIKSIPIHDIANKLGIVIQGKKAFCFGTHKDKTPSISFSLDKNLWNCFGCARGGSNVDLVMAKLDLDFKGALDWIGEQFGLSGQSDRFWKFGSLRHGVRPIRAEVPPKSAQSTFSPDHDVYEWFLRRCTLREKGRMYLQSRTFSESTLAHFQVGQISHPQRAFDVSRDKWGLDRLIKCGLAVERQIPGRKEPRAQLIWWSESILFPAIEDGRITFLQARSFDARAPKYMGLKGVVKPLYNRDVLATLRAEETLMICEGIPDVMAAHQFGAKAVGVLGASSFVAEWVEWLMPYQIVIVPDMDPAGDGFARRIRSLFSARGKIVETAKLPKGTDLAEFMALKSKKHTVRSRND
jgi:DNA primase